MDVELPDERDESGREEPGAQAQGWRSRLVRARKRSRGVLLFAAGVIVALAAAFLYTLLTPAPHQMTPREVSAVVAQVMASATPPPAYSEQVYEIIQPSLVLIQVKSPDANGKSDDGVGSGVVINANGDILTSLHVVTRATEIKLTFADGTESDARVITVQPQIDIAVLRATNPPAQLYPATLGNPHAVHVGDEAFVVGNPLGLYSSMSAGVISGLNRSFKAPNSDIRMKGLFQIDAAVNPGNSGGPLLNRYGQVIGIVAALVNPTGQDVFIGIGFAVPIDAAGGAIGMPLD
jgi:S1-C subfamily serine protease